MLHLGLFPLFHICEMKENKLYITFHICEMYQSKLYPTFHMCEIEWIFRNILDLGWCFICKNYFYAALLS